MSSIGNKSVAVSALQAYLRLSPNECLHVGDQFHNVGNDIAARASCACIWITSPRETGKVRSRTPDLVLCILADCIKRLYTLVT